MIRRTIIHFGKKRLLSARSQTGFTLIESTLAQGFFFTDRIIDVTCGNQFDIPSTVQLLEVSVFRLVSEILLKIERVQSLVTRY